MKRLFAAIAVACALAVSACVPKDGSGPIGTSPEGWHQIAVGAGQVIGKTKADDKVAKASAEIAKYCVGLRTAAMSATIFAPEKQRNAAAMASAAVNTFCDNPPTDVAGALIAVAAAYEAVLAVQKAPGA